MDTTKLFQFDTNEWLNAISVTASNENAQIAQAVKEANEQAAVAAGVTLFLGLGIITWLCIIAACAVGTVLLLWRISILKKNESYADQQENQKSNGGRKQDASLANLKQQAAKKHCPPILTHQNHQQPPKVQAAQTEFSKHPDSRYMPKS